MTTSGNQQQRHRKKVCVVAPIENIRFQNSFRMIEKNMTALKATNQSNGPNQIHHHLDDVDLEVEVVNYSERF